MTQKQILAVYRTVFYTVLPETRSMRPCNLILVGQEPVSQHRLFSSWHVWHAAAPDLSLRGKCLMYDCHRIEMQGPLRALAWDAASIPPAVYQEANTHTGPQGAVRKLPITANTGAGDSFHFRQECYYTLRSCSGACSVKTDRFIIQHHRAASIAIWSTQTTTQKTEVLGLHCRWPRRGWLT